MHDFGGVAQQMKYGIVGVNVGRILVEYYGRAIICNNLDRLYIKLCLLDKRILYVSFFITGDFCRFLLDRAVWGFRRRAISTFTIAGFLIGP